MSECALCHGGQVINDRCDVCGHTVTPPPARDERAAKREAKKRVRAVKRAAMTAVDSATDPKWKTAADSAIDVLARHAPTVSADDVWPMLDAVGLARPHDGRALGERFKDAAKRGVITKTGEFQVSERESRHGAPIQVWRSLIYLAPPS